MSAGGETTAARWRSRAIQALRELGGLRDQVETLKCERRELQEELARALSDDRAELDRRRIKRLVEEAAAAWEMVGLKEAEALRHAELAQVLQQSIQQLGRAWDRTKPVVVAAVNYALSPRLPGDERRPTQLDALRDAAQAYQDHIKAQAETVARAETALDEPAVVVPEDTPPALHPAVLSALGRILNAWQLQDKTGSVKTALQYWDIVALAFEHLEMDHPDAYAEVVAEVRAGGGVDER